MLAECGLGVTLAWPPRFNPIWNQWTNAAAALQGKVQLLMEIDLGYEMLGQHPRGA